MPEDVINGTLMNPEQAVLRQLCFNSCPYSERVDIGGYLAEVSQGTSQQRSAYHAAMDTCRAVEVTDYFFDSCVFDVLMTGEQQFSGMASSAYSDVKRYSSRQPRWTNRTSLELYTKPYSITKPTTYIPNTSDAYRFSSTCCLIRTLLFVYIAHILSRLLMFKSR